MATPYDDQAVHVLEEAERLKLHCMHEESIVLLESLLSENPANVAALEELADNELSLERYDRALIAAKQAVALDHQSYMGHYIIGFVASMNEEWEKAYEELHLANELRSNNAEILRCLGWVLFNMEKRVQGIVTLERSLNLDPDNTLSLCDLGVCYVHAKNFTKAQSLFEHALNLDPLNDRALACKESVLKLQKSIQK
jgi:tetratricopeptide (TPR) repeat protein